MDSEYGVYRALARRLDESGAPESDVFEAVQALRGRRLMETLTAKHGITEPYEPPTSDEVVTLLRAFPRPTALVDITVFDRTVVAHLVDRRGVRSIRVPGDPRPLLTATLGDVGRRTAAALNLVRSTIAEQIAARVTDAMLPGHAMLLSVDDPLANVPWHATPIGENRWGDVVSMSRIAAVAALRYSPRTTASGHAVVAGDSHADLPGAFHECTEIGELVGVAPLLREQCTVDAVADAVRGRNLDVLHLAVHGHADAARGGRSRLLFAGLQGVNDRRWVGFDEIARIAWSARLLGRVSQV